MGKLEFLETNQNFRSYYRTLRDINYFLNSQSELEKDKILVANQVLTKLIFDFIRIDDITFREMKHEQYEKEYRIFQNDFLNIIQSSGENDVDFDDFSALLDEIIGIANLRTDALGKIQKAKQNELTGNEEMESDDLAFEVVLSIGLDDSSVDAEDEIETDEEDDVDKSHDSNTGDEEDDVRESDDSNISIENDDDDYESESDVEEDVDESDESNIDDENDDNDYESENDVEENVRKRNKIEDEGNDERSDFEKQYVSGGFKDEEESDDYYK